MDLQAVRQRWQKGREKLRARKNYLRNRGKAKINAKKRYQKKKNLASFKKKQRIRRKKPWLSKRKHAFDEMGQALTPADLAFLEPGTGELAVVREISPMTGLVTYMVGTNIKSVPVEDLIEDADFPTLEDLEQFYDLLDATFLTDEEEAEFDAADEAYERSHPEEFGIVDTPSTMTASHLAFDFLARKLVLGPGRVDQRGTDSLQRAKLQARSSGAFEDAVLQAAYYAKKRKMTMYGYSGNSFGSAVWRVTTKPSEYLDPISNTGNRMFSVSPELVFTWYDVKR